MFLLDTDHIGLLQLSEGPECERLRARMDPYMRSDFYFPRISLIFKRFRVYTARTGRRSDRGTREKRLLGGFLRAIMNFLNAR